MGFSKKYPIYHKIIKLNDVYEVIQISKCFDINIYSQYDLCVLFVMCIFKCICLQQEKGISETNLIRPSTLQSSTFMYSY